MIKPNWDTFKAKFSENPQLNFEWLCYLLFCKEFDQQQGITRYFNQSGMETNPIQSDGKWIGWEAKFYEDKLSAHIDEFKHKLDITQRKNPEVERLIFFTPIDWTESTKKDTRPTIAQLNVEKHAQALNIEIEWRGASYFESPFVAESNSTIAKHFFSLDTSVFDEIEYQKKHTKLLLKNINSLIETDTFSIELDRSSTIESLQASNNAVTILAGVGGSGKTATIKKWIESHHTCNVAYMFKATEFAVSTARDFLNETPLQGFIDVHRDCKDKVIIIDSAEALLDLTNPDPFREILNEFVENNWKIIFTARSYSVNDLCYQFTENHSITPQIIHINDLTLEQLAEIAKTHNFNTPQDHRLAELICNPFYLNKYLEFYHSEGIKNYKEFKQTLWDNIIKKSKPSRELCFQNIAQLRASQEQFFVTPNCPDNILIEFQKDGVLGYDPAGYFISHDIYEEWALELFIETKFKVRKDPEGFLNEIGQSLAIRRSFRTWLTEKLQTPSGELHEFIEEIIDSKQIATFWKDELLVALMLSDHANIFFETFENELLANNLALLKQLSFMLQIGCKQLDNQQLLKIGSGTLPTLGQVKYFPTKPIGNGWSELIKYTYNHLEQIGIENIGFILPICKDWSLANPTGLTTRYSGLIALAYYQLSSHPEHNYVFDKTTVIHAISNSSEELKEELSKIILSVTQSKKIQTPRDDFHDLTEFILKDLGGWKIAAATPKATIELANFMWKPQPPFPNDYWGYSTGVDHYFGIKDTIGDYYPESAYQSPVYALLRADFYSTLNFIIEFANYAAEKYAASSLDQGQVEQVQHPHSQHTIVFSNRLWCMLRGTEVNSHILASIHMALEKYLFEIAPHITEETLTGILDYIIQYAKSCSLLAVVASICAAHPQKTFASSRKLFTIKQAFKADKVRLVKENQSHGISSIGYGLNWRHKLYQDERIAACEDSHRKLDLESLFISYLLQDSGQESPTARQMELWEILDTYYNELSDADRDAPDTKTWRICLARMDLRKTKLEVEQKDEGTLLTFHPELPKDLQEYSDTSIKEANAPFKHMRLFLWARKRFENDKQHLDYSEYENNPSSVFEEVSEIVSKVKAVNQEDSELSSDDVTYLNFADNIPAYACSVLIRDFPDKLSEEQLDFCKKIILEYAAFPLSTNYHYQVSDGVEPALSTLHFFLTPDEKYYVDAKEIILLTLLHNDFSAHGRNVLCSSIFYVVKKLWASNPNEATSILHAYITLKSSYNNYLLDFWRAQRSHKGHIDPIEKLYDQHENQIVLYLNNELTAPTNSDIKELNLQILCVAFEMLPFSDHNKSQNDLALTISSEVIRLLFNPKERYDQADYTARLLFLKKFTKIILSLPQELISRFILPLLSHPTPSEVVAEYMEYQIMAADDLQAYSNFWFIWKQFEPKIVELCKSSYISHRASEILLSYLLAKTPWNDGAKDWSLFQHKEKRFFKTFFSQITHNETTLYALAKLLDGIGHCFLPEGISWLSQAIISISSETSLKADTTYYIENITRDFIYHNREMIRKNGKLKKELLIILDYLIRNGSVTGYMLREYLL